SVGLQAGVSPGEGRRELFEGGPPGQDRLRRDDAHEPMLRDTMTTLPPLSWASLIGASFTTAARAAVVKAGLGPESLHQIEAEGLQLDRKVHALEAHILGRAESARREVQDGLDPRGDQRL